MTMFNVVKYRNRMSNISDQLYDWNISDAHFVS